MSQLHVHRGDAISGFRQKWREMDRKWISRAFPSDARESTTSILLPEWASGFRLSFRLATLMADREIGSAVRHGAG